MWFKRNQGRNRRLHRHHVLDVKLRSDQVQATRLRLARISLLVIFCTVLGLYLVWRVGELALNTFVYENQDFAIEQVDAQTDGKISPDQLRRWAGAKLGSNLIALKLADVKRNLELVSAIDSVSVERVLPHTLKIRVTERTLIAQVNVQRIDAAGAISVSVYQLDADGMVVQPLDPHFCSVPAAEVNPPLPVICGFDYKQVIPGRRLDLPLVQAALQLIAEYDRSPMFALVELQRVDVSEPRVLVAVTAQGSRITFSPGNAGLQLQRWQQIHNLGLQQQKTIDTADLAVANNVPVRWLMAGAAPAPAPRTIRPTTIRRRHV